MLSGHLAQPESGLSRVATETRRLFQLLTQVDSELHRDSGLSASSRAVLGSLYPDHSLTVPDIAREKNVTRQHIQIIVNELQRLDLVQAVDNPAHKRSALIRLTLLGRLTFRTLVSREEKILQELVRTFDDRKLAQAAETLRELGDFFESGRWREILP